MSLQPHQHRLAVGIDLGTTNSLVATVRNGIAICLPDEAGRTMLPSAVRYHADGGIEVGLGALKAQAVDPRNHRLGQAASWAAASGRHPAEAMPYDFVHRTARHGAAENRAGRQEPGGGLRRDPASLRERAEASLGGALDGAVITVPAYFRRRPAPGHQDAANWRASTYCACSTNRPPPAVAYGLDNASEAPTWFYDLGGGTFDVSPFSSCRAGVFEVLATSGDALGGDDFDHRVFCWVLEQTGLSLLSAKDTRLLLTKSRNARKC